MNRRGLCRIAAGFIFALGLWAYVGAPTAGADDTRAAVQARAEPAATGEERIRPSKQVLVELFTSQGCSSCPPADEYLGELAANSRVVPVAFHVDYWDWIGWKDPYASGAFTQRQRIYARDLGEARVYTPQIVVDGAAGMVGHHKPRVSAAVAKRMMQPADFDLQIDVEPRGEDAALAHLTITLADKSIRTEKRVYVAGLIPRATTAVRDGENGGRTLASYNVVRTLIGPYAYKTRDGSDRLTFELPFTRGQAVAAWIQDDRSPAVDQAAIWYDSREAK